MSINLFFSSQHIIKQSVLTLKKAVNKNKKWQRKVYIRLLKKMFDLISNLVEDMTMLKNNNTKFV